MHFYFTIGMYQLSDSDTTDSDDGVRFKTATTRDKHKSTQSKDKQKKPSRSRSKSPNRYRHRPRARSRSRSKSPRRPSSSQKHRLSSRRSRSRSNDRHRRSNRSKESRRSNDTSKRTRSRSKERLRSVKPVPSSSLKGSQTSLDDSTKEDILNTVCERNVQKSVDGDKNNLNDDPMDVELMEVCGPALPQKSEISVIICGPALPPHLMKSSATEICTKTEKNGDIKDVNASVERACGPALPPKSENTETVCGPALPPHLLKKNTPASENETITSAKEERSIGPFIPEHLRKQLADQSPTNVEYKEENEKVEYDEVHSDDDDDDCYGPLPPELQQKSRAHLALEERALQMKLDQLTPQAADEPGREEWMIELPTVQATNLGLGPRQFRAKPGPDMSDRSSWTDTPNDKKKKSAKAEKAVDLQREAEINAMQKRDEEQEAMVKKAKKKNKRDKSLMEQHQEKLNAKKKVTFSFEMLF